MDGGIFGRSFGRIVDEFEVNRQEEGADDVDSECEDLFASRVSPMRARKVLSFSDLSDCVRLREELLLLAQCWCVEREMPLRTRRRQGECGGTLCSKGA